MQGSALNSPFPFPVCMVTMVWVDAALSRFPKAFCRSLYCEYARDNRFSYLFRFCQQELLKKKTWLCRKGGHQRRRAASSSSNFPLYNPSFHVIFHFIAHLILHYWALNPILLGRLHFIFHFIFHLILHYCGNIGYHSTLNPL